MDANHARPDDGGWTLLELMAVVMILGILVSIAVATFASSTERARRVTCQSNQHILTSAVVTYEEAHNGALPPDLDALEPYVQGRDAHDTCPGTGQPYGYEPLNGRVSCPVHAAQ